MEDGPGMKMFFLLNMGIFQPAMLLYQRIYNITQKKNLLIPKAGAVGYAAKGVAGAVTLDQSQFSRIRTVWWWGLSRVVILLMAEIPNNHLGWCWNPINNGKNYLSLKLVFSAGFQPFTLPKTNSQFAPGYWWFPVSKSKTSFSKGPPFSGAKNSLLVSREGKVPKIN